MQRYHAILVELAVPTNTTFQAIVRQLASRMVRSGGSDPVTAHQQAMAAVDGIISTQAALLSFEHAFQVVVSRDSDHGGARALPAPAGAQRGWDALKRHPGRFAGIGQFYLHGNPRPC